VQVYQQTSDVIQMVWSHKVNDQDVRNSFKLVNQLLEAANHPIFVAVDISADPNFPIAATLTGALFGPYRNPNLREWLIIGSNSAARFIERTLSGATGRVIVRWFESRAEVDVYVEQAIALKSHSA